jgi:hypothetical protein
VFVTGGVWGGTAALLLEIAVVILIEYPSIDAVKLTVNVIPIGITPRLIPVAWTACGSGRGEGWEDPH